MKDLMKDWNAGGATDLAHFIPAKYSLKFHFNQFELFLNVNDKNIINKPNDVTENGSLSLL
jgi:hypothetical protein